MRDMEDREIIELFFQRSERAIAELSYKYGSKMRRVAFHLLQDLEDAEECVNDAYLATWNAIPPERPDPLLAYVCRVTKNVSITRLRKKKAKKRNVALERSLEELEELEGALPSGKTLEEQWEDERITEAIQSFLEGLDQKSRVTFVKRYWFGQSLESIAKDLSMRENGVAVKLLRIRRKLKKYLEKEGIIL